MWTPVHGSRGPVGSRTISPSRSRPASARSRRSPSNGSAHRRAARRSPARGRSGRCPRSAPPAAGRARRSRARSRRATGHAAQSGVRGRQTVAPSSIIAWLNVAARPPARAPPRARATSTAAPSRRVKHAADVRVDGRDLHVPRERGHRRRRVRADARQHGQIGRPAVRGNDRRRALQRQSAPVVAEAATTSESTSRTGAAASDVHVGQRGEPALVVRHDPQRLGLLEHHLAHQQRVRVARRAPRQRPAHPLVPLQQRLDIHARTHSQRADTTVCDRS